MKYVGENSLKKIFQIIKAQFAAKSDVPTKVSDLTNDSGFLTSAPVTSVNSKTGAVSLTASDVGAAASSHSHGAATTSAAGFMSAADKTKLDGVATGANKITVDTALSSSSTNPVQNKVINTALSGKAASSHSHSAATTGAAGFMSAADKTKLDGIATGANKITVDTALSSSSTNPVQNKVINTALSGKAASSHNHAASNITSGTLAVARGGTGVTSIDALKTALGISGASAKIQTGSYVGTGTYGSSNPCTLTFDFSPKIVLVALNLREYHTYVYGVYFIRGQESSNGISYPLDYNLLLDIQITWDGNKITWASLSKGDSEQLNISGKVYFYVAIG